MDGDFAELVRHLKHAMGVRVEVIAFGKSSSSKLKEAADSFTDLDDAPRKYLMRSMKPRRDIRPSKDKPLPK